jgi:hypothetical protein
MLRTRDRIRFDAYEFQFTLDVLRDAQKTIPAGGAAQDTEDEATRLKSGKCPTHESQEATDLCVVCRVAYCQKCVTEKNGQIVCIACQIKEVELT